MARYFHFLLPVLVQNRVKMTKEEMVKRGREWLRDYGGYANTFEGNHVRFEPANRLTADGWESLTSDINVSPGETLANMAIVTVAADNEIDVDNSQGDVDAIIDIEGWFG